MDDAKELTDQYRIDQWASVIQGCIDSGKSAKDWCAENNISRDKYYYWLRKVKLAATGVPQTKTSKIGAPPMIVPLLPNSFAGPDDTGESPSDQVAMVIRSSGLVLEIKNNATEAVIGRVLKVLKQL